MLEHPLPVPTMQTLGNLLDTAERHGVLSRYLRSHGLTELTPEMVQFDDDGNIIGWRPTQLYDSATNEQRLVHEEIVFAAKPQAFADQLSYGTLLWNPDDEPPSDEPEEEQQDPNPPSSVDDGGS